MMSIDTWADVASDPRDRRRLVRFADDLGRWLATGQAAEIDPLAQVVIRVAHRELAPVAQICAARPEIATLSGVHAAVAVWRVLFPDGVRGEEGMEERLEDGAARDVAAGAEAAVGRSLALHSTLERLVAGVSWSLDGGSLHKAMSADIDRWAQLLRRSEELKRLADGLGRSVGARATSARVPEGGPETAGVTLSGDVHRALSHELGLLGDPDAEDIFFGRLMEGRLLSLDVKGPTEEPSPAARRGPVIACIDASASMYGEREWLAKGALLNVARATFAQGRAMHVIVFGGRGQRLERSLGRGGSTASALLDLLAFSFDGGTDFDGPLNRALDLVSEPPWAAADVWIVTDGEGGVDPATMERMRQSRDRFGVRVIAGLVDSARNRRPDWTDEAWAIDRTGVLARLVD
jgi:uncharacterized protein with von Willebrand factor type A (vWA) domain